jgi:magnesium transporter
MISVDVCDGRRTRREVAPERIRDLVRGARDGNRGNGRDPAAAGSGRNVLWVDVSAPTDADWATLTDAFRFHPLALEDARKQNQRAKIDAYDRYLFLTLRAWVGTRGATDDLTDATQEVDIFLGPNYLVTVHAGDCPPVEETRRRWERHPEQLREARDNPAFLLYLLLDAVVDDYFPAMDSLDTEIDALETAIYSPTPDAAVDLAPALALKKRLLLLRQAVSPMRDVVNQLLRVDDAALVPAATRVYLQDVYDHTLRLVEQVDLHRDILGGVIDAMMAQTNNRLNQVMKTLTGISTILMSAALISGIYGMNFKHMPELETRYGYYAALGAMVAVAGGLAVYFRRIKWF